MAINTTINGSTGTCREAADWLGDLAGQAEAAGGWYYRGIAAAESGWEGPAHDAFAVSVDGVGRKLDDLDYTAREYERALREFADALDKVIDRMNSALDKARSGGLEVEEPFIKEPSGPGPPPETAIGMVRPDTPPEQVRIIQQANEEYNEQVRAHNAKVDAYNECLEIAKDAHNREDEAHANLREVMAGPEDWDIDGWKVGTTTAGNVLSAVGGLENERAAALSRAQTLADEARVLQKWATGTLLNMTDARRELLLSKAGEARAAEASYRERVAEFQRYTEKVPDKIRAAAAHYPGKGQLPPGSGRAASVLKGLPYASSITVIGTEAVGAFKGEQSWTQAAARSGGTLAGSWAGAQVGAGLGIINPALTPLGMIAGGVAGGFAGGHVVEYFVPDPSDELYEPMPNYETVEIGEEGRR
ncbi:hypothetical protein SAMN06265360_10177 [Haloechinothrix alba]|uniref:Uncharacterized protein n=1 Tax=Haloechinothrix alba TaxID=664784 RepID=A0A238V1P1_9PSEU|nr:hypothetical protein [Haloechinothrix alba]SNR27493.1 hypothetical protein SAMN06265360_10177 [Haloechinothrix alba]